MFITLSPSFILSVSSIAGPVFIGSITCDCHFVVTVNAATPTLPISLSLSVFFFRSYFLRCHAHDMQLHIVCLNKAKPFAHLWGVNSWTWQGCQLHYHVAVGKDVGSGQEQVCLSPLCKLRFSFFYSFSFLLTLSLLYFPSHNHCGYWAKGKSLSLLCDSSTVTCQCYVEIFLNHKQLIC